MAQSSKRMRFKDKIIANIAKSIKGIQGAVFYRSRNNTNGDDSPLVLCNSDRQCHKLCENLDHVFLHGLRKHSNGYWKIVTECTHKDSVRVIEKLSNVTTDFGRGRAWIFMALNDVLTESYIRCLTENTRFLKKHYEKDALLLDQQQMSVLLTLTAGLECVVFKLEYDLPYLDLTACPPRARTASELKEEEEVANSCASHTVGLRSRLSSETMASTPESAKGLTDSDSASLSSLDAANCSPRVIGNSIAGSNRVSFVSVDSGFPGDILSPQPVSKQRSATPFDTISVSSHNSVGEPDRLTRLESIVTDDTVDERTSELEVIRVKGGRKGSTGGRIKKNSSKKSGKRDRQTLADVTGSCGQRSGWGGGEDVLEFKLGGSVDSSDILVNRDSISKDQTGPSGKVVVPLSHDRERLVSGKLFGANGVDDLSDKSLGAGDLIQSGHCLESSFHGLSYVPKDGSSQSAAESRAERLAVKAKDSLSDQFTQLDSALAVVKRTASGLHKQREQSRTLSFEANDDTLTDRSYGEDVSVPDTVQTTRLGEGEEETADNSAIVCDNFFDGGFLTEQKDSVAGYSKETEGGALSALQELESKCAQLCMLMTQEDSGSFTAQDFADSSENLQADLEIASEKQRQGADPGDKKKAAEVSTHSEEEEMDFYSAPSEAGISQLVENHTDKANQLHDYLVYISGHHQRQDVVINGQRDYPHSQKQERTKDYALRLDNNTKLHIMLDVLPPDDEEFIKMFACREGHSEGEMKVTFILITDCALYLLKQRDLDHKFESEIRVPLCDLSFITLSLNKQIINIESSGPNRKKKRIWLTPGDHLLAQQILDCLESAMRNIQQRTSLKAHFTVGSDELLQIIALRKYIARDSNCEEQEVDIMDYSLVFWEDTMSSPKKQNCTSREGTMLLRVPDPFKGHVWKPVFVVLRDFMLCIFGDKCDSKPQRYVRLGGEQCIGCRLTATQDRPHCIEIILAKGGSWFLSVATEELVASWRHSLCLAVSEGMQDSTNLYCLPCVSVVTKQKLLLCHEDLQTKFCRTIGSAKVEEVTALTIDPEDNTYCVVEFESQEEGITSERWVLYFNSPLELERFVQALSRVWREVYQVPLTASPVEDPSLLQHCQDQVALLQRAVAMK